MVEEKDAKQLELFPEPPNTSVYYKKKDGNLGQFNVPTNCSDEAIDIVKEHLKEDGEEYNSAVLAVVKGVPKCLAKGLE